MHGSRAPKCTEQCPLVSLIVNKGHNDLLAKYTRISWQFGFELTINKFHSKTASANIIGRKVSLMLID